MANSLASSADEVLGASTLPQEPVYFAPIPISSGLYSGQRLDLMNKYEAEEMAMAKRSEALQRSIVNTEDLLRKQEALNVQSDTISKISEILEPLSPTYSQDRSMFLDMASRSPAVANALAEADRNHQRYNRVMDDYVKVVASGTTGKYRDQTAKAQIDLMGAFGLLRSRGEAALPLIRMSTFKYLNQAADARSDHNKDQWELSQVRKAKEQDIEFNKELALAPIDLGFEDDQAEAVKQLVMADNFKEVERLVTGDFLGRTASPSVPEELKKNFNPVELKAESLVDASSGGFESFKSKFTPKRTSQHITALTKDLAEDYEESWENFLKDLYDRLGAVKELKKKKRSYEITRSFRGGSTPMPRPRNAPPTPPTPPTTATPEGNMSAEQVAQMLMPR